MINWIELIAGIFIGILFASVLAYITSGTPKEEIEEEKKQPRRGILKFSGTIFPNSQHFCTEFLVEEVGDRAGQFVKVNYLAVIAGNSALTVWTMNYSFPWIHDSKIAWLD